MEYNLFTLIFSDCDVVKVTPTYIGSATFVSLSQGVFDYAFSIETNKVSSFEPVLPLADADCYLVISFTVLKAFWRRERLRNKFGYMICTV